MKTLLITGANRGIGLALTQLYLSQGWKVLAVCRNSTPELDQSGAVIISGIDVTQAEALTHLAQQVGDSKLDLIINNAGLLAVESLGELSEQSITQQFLINALAPLKVTEALLHKLAANAKLAFITSRMGSIADNGSGGYYGYRMSKAALNAGVTSLARDLQAQGIAVALLHPGFVQTAMVNYGGDISPATAAERLAQRIDELTLATSGGFWHSNGERLPW